MTRSARGATLDDNSGEVRRLAPSFRDAPRDDHRVVACRSLEKDPQGRPGCRVQVAGVTIGSCTACPWSSSSGPFRSCRRASSATSGSPATARHRRRWCQGRHLGRTPERGRASLRCSGSSEHRSEARWCRHPGRLPVHRRRQNDQGENEAVGRRPVGSSGVIRPAASVLLLAEALPMLRNRPLAAPMSGRAP
jgi:hypothetical protein